MPRTRLAMPYSGVYAAQAKKSGHHHDILNQVNRLFEYAQKKDDSPFIESTTFSSKKHAVVFNKVNGLVDVEAWSYERFEISATERAVVLAVRQTYDESYQQLRAKLFSSGDAVMSEHSLIVQGTFRSEQSYAYRPMAPIDSIRVSTLLADFILGAEIILPQH